MKSSDQSFMAFLKLQAQLPQYDLISQTEADTRARLISRLLEDVLDWPPENISREEHANPGFMDYVLSTQRRIAVVEAKKSGDTFELPADISTSASFTLNGILRTVKNLEQYVVQVINYCFSNGIEFAVITNGLQWVIFRALRTDGIHFRQGNVIVFKSIEDIESRFIEFWSLLAYQNVLNNSLIRKFQPSDAPLFQYRRVADELHTYSEKVSRNALSIQLEPLLQEYMGEITDEHSKEKLRELFVKGPALSQILDAVEHRISLALPDKVRLSGRIFDVGKVEHVRAGVKQKITTALSLPSRGEVLLLLGRVGSGKSTFVNHFLRVDLKDSLKNHLLVFLDFRLLGRDTSIHKFFYDHLRETLAKNDLFLTLSEKHLRHVFSSEIRELSTGPLAALERTNKKRYEEKITDFLVQKFNDPETYFARMLRYFADRVHVRCLFVFDNVDQLDFALQQDVFTFAHSVAGNTHAFCLMTMWEETYVRSRRGGALSAYPIFAYRIPPTSVVDIISRRLEYTSADLSRGGLAKSLLSDPGAAGEVTEFLSLVRRSILHDKRRVRLFLESLTLGNLRQAMDVFSLFLTSGHTDTGKILSIWRAVEGYTIPLHEFIKSIGLGDQKYYQSDVSTILNLYSISDESRPSHFTKIRLLEYLFFHRNRSTAVYGLGFVRTDILQKEFSKIGTSEPDIAESLKSLAAASLVENDIYDYRTISDAYRITYTGRYYIRHLKAKFTYLDLVLQDTPIGDEEIFTKIKSLVSNRDLEDRFERVGCFVQYLRSEEDREYPVVLSTSESLPLRRQFAPEMMREFEEDKVYILQQVKKRRRDFKGEPTPYREVPDIS